MAYHMTGPLGIPKADSRSLRSRDLRPSHGDYGNVWWGYLMEYWRFYMVLYGFTWFYMVLYGFIWLYMDLYGFIWFYLVLYG
jgi:hypothetical protein